MSLDFWISKGESTETLSEHKGSSHKELRLFPGGSFDACTIGIFFRPDVNWLQTPPVSSYNGKNHCESRAIVIVAYRVESSPEADIIFGHSLSLCRVIRPLFLKYTDIPHDDSE